MFNNLQEEVNFFAPNVNLNAKIEEFYPGEKIVIIDNFYANPKEIQNLALAIPPTYNPGIVSGVPGGRVDVTYYLHFLSSFFNEIINDVFFPNTQDYDCTETMSKSTFCVNVVNETVNMPDVIPHMDGGTGFAAGVYLNDPKDCIGGTSFYTYKDSLSPEVYPDNELNIENYPGYILDDYKDFKKIYLAEMKFNRFILYKRNVLHTAYIPKNAFSKKSPRLMQMFFI